MADLPRFGEARQAGAKAKFLLLQNADAPSLLASTRAALEQSGERVAREVTACERTVRERLARSRSHQR